MSESSTTLHEAEPTSCHRAFDEVAKTYPNIEGLLDKDIRNAAENLVSEFGIKNEFFEGDKAPAHTLILASIASNLAALEGAGKNPLMNPRDFEYIADATFIVAMDYVTGYDELVAANKAEAFGSVSDDAKEAAFKKYKSPELTDALKKRIDEDGLLTDLKVQLGITKDNEDPYELLIVSVSGSELGVYGFSENSQHPADELWEADRVHAVAMSKDAIERDELGAAWRQELLTRREGFGAATGVNFVSPAFVETVNGITYLCLAADIAERIAYADDVEHRSSLYDEGDFKRDLAVLYHEYTHTQGGINLENLFAAGVEELRAEEYSGNHLGYQDVKYFFQDISFITGYNLVKSLKGRTKGGEPDEVFADIAQNLGLEKLIKVVGALPETYVRDKSGEILRSFVQYTDGYNGVLEELMEDTKALGHEADAFERMDRAIDNIGKGDPNFLKNYLSTRLQYAKYGTSLLMSRLEAS